jgi:uncharacterized protein (DUF362 family)
MDRQMKDKITRRSFLKRSTGAVISASAFGAAYFALDQQPDFPIEDAALSVNADYSIYDISMANKLAVAEGDDPAELGRKVVNSLGGIEKFIARNDRVVIKPNAAWDRTPEQAACTNPLLIAELVRLCLKAGASEVVVTDVTCHDARRTFARSGIKEAAENAGAKVIFAAEDDFVNVDFGGGILTNWPVLKHFLETDKVINVPIVKNHTLSRATLGMKNLYGIIGGQRGQLHQKIDRSIVDLASFLKPTLVVVDAYRVLMRNGPVGGSIGDVKTSKTVFATTDQVAADTFACQFLDLDPARVGHIVLAQSEGLGSMDISKLEIIRG